MTTGHIFEGLGLAFAAAVALALVRERIAARRARQAGGQHFPRHFWQHMGAL